MMFRKSDHPQKQDKHSEKAPKENLLKTLTPEELQQIALEMSWGCGMMLPGGFPDGIWYFY